MQPSEKTEILGRDELNDIELQLISEAEKVAHHSYSPYSHFQVGAAVLLEGLITVTGANQENASYPEGMCAERVAIFSAASQFPDKLIKKIAVVGRRKDHHQLTPVTPCGGCRQVLLEYELAQQAPIEMLMLIGEDQWLKTRNIQVLLPFAFTKKSIG